MTLYQIEQKDPKGNWRRTPLVFRSKARAQDTIRELPQNKEYRVKSFTARKPKAR